MSKKDFRIYFAILRTAVDDMPVSSIIDILRYEGARPLANSPPDWYAFEKASNQAVTVPRLNSFAIKTDQVFIVRADAAQANGSCPVELRDAIAAKHPPAPDVVNTTDLGAHLKELAGDILTTSVEGGSGYWAEISHVPREEDLTPICATFRDRGNPKAPEVQVTRPMVIQALRKLAGGQVDVGREYVGNAALALVGRADGGDFDVTGADVVVQVAVFGTVLYG